MSDANDIAATLKIVRVTTYEDRADVVREGAITLPAGSAVIVVKDLPAVLSDEHVVARLEPVSGAAHVNDTRVDRYVVGGDDALAARRDMLAKQIEALDDDIATAEEAHRRASAERAQAEVALRRYIEALTRAAGAGDGNSDVWSKSVDAFAKALAAADAARASTRAVLDELRKKRARAAADARPAPTGQKTVAELRLRVSSTGGPCKLVVSTLLPCAAWRPTHEAQLLEEPSGDATVPTREGARVKFVTYAAVWNRTGEAWRDVELVLSTARPSAGAELPVLRADRLTLRHKTAEEKRTIVVEHREESVPKSATQGAAPGVDDGGEARTFKASRVTVPDDGRPHRVEVATFTAPAKTERVAFPELVPQVFLRASLKNAGTAPILAGPVTLLMHGTYVGTGDVAFVGSGESFDLSFGSDDRFTVRTKKRRADDKKLVGKDVVHFVREAVLVQTGQQTERVVVHMRVPVSEVKQVKVLPSPQHTTVEVVPDEHGIVRVPVELAPNVEKKLAIAFSFDASGDVRIPDPW